MNACQICNKEYKRAQDLKAHMTKMHKQPEQIIEVPEVSEIPVVRSTLESSSEYLSYSADYSSNCEIDNDEPQSLQLPEDESILSEFLPESESDSLFNLSMDSEQISTNKCEETAHCETCTCFQKQIKVDHISSIKQSMKGEEYKTKYELPQNTIRDICLVGDKILETDINGDKLYRQVQFKHYKSPEITNRVVKNTFDYEMRSLSTYMKQKEYTHEYLNFRNGLTEYEAVMKYTIENKINYSAKGFNPTMIGFDVEAFHPTITDRNVIPSHKNGGVISMICAAFSKQNENDKFIVYLLDQYKYNEAEINEFIQNRRSDLKMSNINQYTLQVIPCENQTIMACQFLDDVKACGISILYGFNSSATAQQDKINDQGKIIERVSIGYDLPFIIHNSCRYTQQEVEHGAKLFGKVGKQIKKIHWLPNAYILDCLVVFQNDRYFAMQLSDMPNRKLNSFLQASKLPVKEDDKNIYERMDQMRIKRSDQTACINYCLWDAFSLTSIMNTIKYIDSVKANVEIFNIPLSWALHKNATNWCTMMQFRRHYEAGYAFSYAKYPIDANKIKFRGATTESCPKDLIQQVLSDIAMWDFQSLYPNAIISANLGIDSLREQDDGNCFAVNLNFVDPYLVESVKQKQIVYQSMDTSNMTKDQLNELKKDKITKSDLELLKISEIPNIVYFSKVPSINAIIIAEILQKRLDIKAQMKGVDQETYNQLDARQNAVKIFVNTIYGLTGAETYQLGDMRVASACTSISRQLTYFARQSIEELKIGQVVFRDTDSCGVMMQKESIMNIYKQSEALNILVNQKLQQSLGTQHFVKFVLEGENFQEKTYYPKAKKAYARIECNVNDIIMNKPITRDLKIKGVSWSLMSSYGKEFFRYHTEYILLNFQQYNDISEYITKVLDSVRADIEELIKSKNYSEIIRKYHKQIKNSQSNNTAKYLRKTYNVMDNEVQILPIIKASKLKSKCVIPAYLAKQHEIDQNQLLNWFISPFQKFYGKYEYEQIKYDETETLIECRLASGNNYHSKTKKFRIDEIMEKLGNKSISYNEIVQAENKLFFDIDDAKNSLNFQRCLDIIEKMICKFRHQSLEVQYAYTKSTSTLKPHSYHVVYQIRASMGMNKYIAQQVNQEMDFQIIDIALYSRNKSLRLPNSPKFNEKAKKLDQIYHNVVYGTLEQMFISDIAEVQNSLSNAIGFIETRHKELGYKNININDKYIAEIKDKIPFPVELSEQDRGAIKITPLSFPYICPVCTRKHKSLGMVAYLKDSGFIINCWSGKNADKLPIKHTFEKQTSTSLKQQRINKLLEFTQMSIDYKFKRLNPANITFQNNQQVQYDLSAQTTFVRSQMMTGKTKQQVKLTEQGQFNTILALSFRRTFARDNAEKNSFVNYENVEGDLNLIDYPHLILQVDSLARLNTAVKPQLLIIDEVESTIEQLLAIKRDTSPYILYKFIELLQSAEKILFLDAELEQSTIECMSQLIGTDNYKVFVNTFQPKQDSKIIVHDYVSNSNADNTEITSLVNQLIKDNKRVVIFATSRERAFAIKSQFPSNKIVKYYDGEDGKKYDKVSMAKIKLEDFKDVNKSWADCDVLIYTGTLTAGISFELDRFDTFIGIYSRNTSSPLGFTQGLHRVRNFADKLGHIFLENEGSYLPETAYQITENQTNIYGHTDLSEISQFKNWLEASTNQSKNNRLQLVIRNLVNMGYQLGISGESAPQKCRDESSKYNRENDMKQIVQAQITLQDITEIPKIMKSTNLIINNTDDLLHPKYMKIKLFRSFYPKPYNQEQINHINTLNDIQITKLYAERPRIAESNKFKNLLEKCLNNRPELKDLGIDQMDQLTKACELESKQNIKAQFAETAQKDSIIKFYQQIYIVTQAIKIRDSLTELNQENLENALKILTNLKIESDKIDEKTKSPIMIDNPVANTLKSIGIKFDQSGIHHKLNKILKYIDLEIKTENSKRITINSKKIRINTYKLISISAESVINQIAEYQQ